MYTDEHNLLNSVTVTVSVHAHITFPEYSVLHYYMHIVVDTHLISVIYNIIVDNVAKVLVTSFVSSLFSWNALTPHEQEKKYTK